MKYLKISLFILFLPFISCAQKEVKKEDIMNQENIQKVANIYKEVKTYDYNPVYLLQIENKNCAYEIYINDVLVAYSFFLGLSTGATYTNTSIHSEKW